MRATGCTIAGKKALVLGFETRQGVCGVSRAVRWVAVTEIDPICAPQACKVGLDVVRPNDVVCDYDIFVTTTGNKDIISEKHMLSMKHNAIVCNIGHFDNEIHMAGLEAMLERGEVEKIEIKPQVHEWKFKNTTHGPNGQWSLHHRARRRSFGQSGCATGHPSLVMSASFTNQVIAQVELHNAAETYGDNMLANANGKKPEVVTLPKHLDEKACPAPLGEVWCQTHHPDPRPSRLHWGERRRSIQTRALPLLNDTSERPSVDQSPLQP